MSELTPIPLPLLLRRAFLEYQREGKIFDLPANKFFRGLKDLDTSVICNGHRASTPLGPAAGPHDQLAQNIVLCWLGGARIIELKTVQVQDDLKIPRPCIDAANVGYNVEWSQELKLDQSLREYVSAAMFLEVLKDSHLLGEGFPGTWGDTIFDMSVGYNLEGIRSPRVSAWIQLMKNAAPIIDELRTGFDGPFAAYRDLPFASRISDTITLSTFHGCPADEIEAIVYHLLTEMDVHVCVKLNPTLLAREPVEHLLHDVLGYQEIQCSPEAFDHDLQFDEALDLVPRLQAIAKAHGKHFSVKFSNTLVVKNHKSYFQEDVMYLSGPPLHVITMNLVKKFRESLGASVPISFSAGIDAGNFPSAVAMNLAPVTTCTDLLRPGGYSRLSRYMANLADHMREVGATNIEEFILQYRGQAVEARAQAAAGIAPSAVAAAGLLNTPLLVTEATGNPRYSWERNKGVPRKIGSNLWYYDCINCDKCVPVCPNDAIFTYEAPVDVVQYDNFEQSPDGIRRIPGGLLKLIKEHQIANYADACNECGNCDVLCPEEGGPFIAKPRFFGSLETWQRYGRWNGFYIEYAGDRKTLHGTVAGKTFMLIVDRAADRSWFDDGERQIEICLSTGQVLDMGGAARVDMAHYQHLKLLLESVSSPKSIHFANIAGLSIQEKIVGNRTSPVEG